MTSCVVLLLLAIGLSGLGPASSQSWATFRRKHIDNSVQSGNDDYCDTRMRKINNKKSCKPKNTLIHEVPCIVKAMCCDVTSSLKERSKEEYKVTICHLRNRKATPPECKYEATNDSKNVWVKCKKGVPVHLEDRELAMRRG